MKNIYLIEFHNVEKCVSWIHEEKFDSKSEAEEHMNISLHRWAHGKYLGRILTFTLSHKSDYILKGE